jgi:hypothetical protein
MVNVLIEPFHSFQHAPQPSVLQLRQLHVYGLDFYVSCSEMVIDLDYAFSREIVLLNGIV